MTFGIKGVSIVSFSGQGADAHAMLIQTDGKIVLAGYTNISSRSVFAIARLTSDGSADNSFGTNGIVILPIGTRNSCANAIAIQNDSNLVAAGSSSIGTKSAVTIARFTNTGKLDSTFGTNGISIASYDSSDGEAFGMAVQTDGKIVLVGSFNHGFGIARFTKNGEVDKSFNRGGWSIFKPSNSNGYARSVAIQKDGKIVAAGGINAPNDPIFAVARLNADGTADRYFGDYWGSYGLLLSPICMQISSIALAVGIQPNGNIVVAGVCSSVPSVRLLKIVRYTAAGKLDSTFGFETIANCSADAMAFQTDGKIVAAGMAKDSNTDFFLARFDDNGYLDTVFGAKGKTITSIDSGYDGVRAMAIQTDGKIVLAGFSETGSEFSFAVARYCNDLSSSTNTTGGFKANLSSRLNPFFITNPAKNFLKICLTQCRPHTKLIIGNIAGKEIIKRQIDNSKAQIDISMLPSGVYYVNFVQGHKLYTDAFIKE